jgi:dTDP-4-amino-4,6-dideoxygalactose transaminase
MKLALFGGKKIRNKPYPPHTSTGQEEIEAVIDVLKTGILSDFEGSNNEWFLGGPQVKAAEKVWTDYFGVKHAVSVNSATSGLYAAVGAAGVGPGDEVITTPWTMTATAAAIIVNNAIPIFADIELDTFCISPADVEKKITPRTKAIIPVHIYGYPADMDPIMEIAQKHNLVVIEDVSQSPGARYKGRLTSTIGHMGVHSLNCHKLIQTGEGGFIMTNDDDLALRLQMIRNHAEAVVATGMKVSSIVNMVGWNYRMNEMEAAIAIIQLKKLKTLQRERTRLAHYLTEKLSKFEGLALPFLDKDCDHTYYRYAVRIDPKIIPVSGKTFVDALNAEGLDWYAGYTPLNLYPLFQQQIAFGDKGCPFKCSYYKGNPDYSLDGLPNVRYQMKYSFSTENIRPPLTFNDMDLMVEGFEKVFTHIGSLVDYESKASLTCN